MKTVKVTFSQVEIGGFFYFPPLGEWLVKTSRRSAYLKMYRYTPNSGTPVEVLA